MSGRTPDPRLVFDGVEDLIDQFSKWNLVKLCFVLLASFGSAPRWLADGGGVATQILPRGELLLWLLELGALSRGEIRHSTSHLLYLDVLLSPKKDIPHLGDIILDQIFVEGIGDLQPLMKVATAMSKIT